MESLVSSNEDGRIQFWAMDGHVTHTLNGVSAAPRTLCAFGSDGICCADKSEKSLQVFLIGKGHESSLRISCPGHVAACCVSRGGELFAAAIGTVLNIWDSATGGVIANFPSGHHRPIRILKFTSDAKLLISAGEDAQILVWNLFDLCAQRRQPLYTWSAHNLPITDLVVGAGACRRLLFSSSEDRSVKIFSFADGACRLSLAYSASVTCLGADTMNANIYVGTASGEIHHIASHHLMDKSLEKDSDSWKGHQASISCLAVSADGNQLASGDSQGKLLLWSTTTGKVLKTIKTLSCSNITNLVFMNLCFDSTKNRQRSSAFPSVRRLIQFPKNAPNPSKILQMNSTKSSNHPSESISSKNFSNTLKRISQAPCQELDQLKIRRLIRNAEKIISDHACYNTTDHFTENNYYLDGNDENSSKELSDGEADYSSDNDNSVVIP